MSSRRVAIDAGVLIWANRTTPKNDAERDQIDRCRLLLQWLEEEEAVVLLPAPALSEYLVGFELPQRPKVAAELNRAFEIVPVDARCCVIAADLFTKNRNAPKSHRLKRNCLKVDVFIIAASKIAGARTIYSLDEKFRKLAETCGMEAPELPTHDENLFREHERQNGL